MVRFKTTPNLRRYLSHEELEITKHSMGNNQYVQHPQRGYGCIVFWNTEKSKLCEVDRHHSIQVLGSMCIYSQSNITKQHTHTIASLVTFSWGLVPEKSLV